MKLEEIYDPAMCCSTGVCGPSVDPELVRIKEALRQIEMMREMLQEDNWRGASFHSNSANNYLRSISAGGMVAPEWLDRNAGFLRAQGWRW